MTSAKGRQRGSNLFTSEEDSHRDFVSDGPGNFFSEFKKPEKTYEYVVKEAEIDRTKHDPKYQEHLQLMAVRTHTIDKNNILLRLLAKRYLTDREKARMAELNVLSDNDKINRDQERELQTLRDIELRLDGDINMQQLFRGLKDIYYYTDARHKLRPGTQFTEFNQLITKSHEPENIIDSIDEDAKHLTIIVSTGDLLTECIKAQTKGLKPVVGLCGSRLCPGGQWEQGIMGIEEEIYYRSSVSVAYSNEICGGFYILQDEATLYAPKILLYKKPASEKFELLNDSSKAFFGLITYAPEYLPEDSTVLSEDQKEMLKNKFRNLIQTALYWGHDCIVMNPFGMGPPGNYPAAEVTAIFKRVIFAKKHKFYARLKRVIIVFPHQRSQAYQVYNRDLNGITHEI